MSKPKIKIFCKVISNLLHLIILLILINSDKVSATNQEQVNVGFIFSLPWDISNTMRAPLAGPLSIILTSFTACIMVFGLLAAPVWYLFGWPKRRYNLHDLTSKGNGRGFENYYDVNDKLYRVLQGNYSSGNYDDFINHIGMGQSLIDNSTMGRETRERRNLKDNNNVYGVNYPEFTNSLFLFVPEIEEGCKRLMVCHAHGYLPFLPDSLMGIYRYFSKKLLNVPQDYKTAIQTGLEDQSLCMKKYDSECSQDILSIAKLTLFHMIPNDTRELWQLKM